VRPSGHPEVDVDVGQTRKLQIIVRCHKVLVWAVPNP
jgi:hypothetical protein